MIPQETLRELSDLRARVADLEERERLLFEERSHAVKSLRLAFPKLSVSHARMIWAMSRGKIMERAALMALIGADEFCDERIIDSHIKRIRRCVPDIAIMSHYGIGYELCEPWVTRVKAIVSGQAA